MFVDDGSTDKFRANNKKNIKEKNSNVKYYKKENGGLSDARNYGMKYAQSEYIAFLDSDDFITTKRCMKKCTIKRLKIMQTMWNAIFTGAYPKVEEKNGTQNSFEDEIKNLRD